MKLIKVERTKEEKQKYYFRILEEKYKFIIKLIIKNDKIKIKLMLYPVYQIILKKKYFQNI